MLEHIHLENFKASRDVPVRLEKLTVIAGLNGSGKSTLLQALAALKQSYASNSEAGGLLLIGDLVQLGKYKDVLTEGAINDLIGITVIANKHSYKWECIGRQEETLLRFKNSPGVEPFFFDSHRFQYLQADRLVPRTLYPQAPQQAREFGFLGVHGEYTVDFLVQAETNNLLIDEGDNRRLPEDSEIFKSSIGEKAVQSLKFIDQVGGWMQYISPGIRINAATLDGTDETRLQYSYVGRKGLLESDMKYRPTNVGFGITYSLPVVVACLAAHQGSTLLLENPEAHLHPKGQSALGNLLARTASDGIQVIVETHSDHLLNGIRLAVKNKVIKEKDVAVHYFTRSIQDGDVSVQSPSVNSDGSLSNWPMGFFDEWDTALEKLVD